MVIKQEVFVLLSTTSKWFCSIVVLCLGTGPHPNPSDPYWSLPVRDVLWFYELGVLIQIPAHQSLSDGIAGHGWMWVNLWISQCQSILFFSKSPVPYDNGMQSCTKWCWSCLSLLFHALRSTALQPPLVSQHVISFPEVRTPGPGQQNNLCCRTHAVSCLWTIHLPLLTFRVSQISAWHLQSWVYLTILIALNGVCVTALICSLCLPGHTCLVCCQRQVFTAVSTAEPRYLQSSRLCARLCRVRCQENYHPQSDSWIFVLRLLNWCHQQNAGGKTLHRAEQKVMLSIYNPFVQR